MITNIEIRNFEPLKQVDWHDLSQINLIIGKNGTGKTILLKALYTAIRSQEETNRGDDIRRFEEVLADKLYWTFQPDKIGDLVCRHGNGQLSCSITIDGIVLKCYDIEKSDIYKKIKPNIKIADFILIHEKSGKMELLFVEAKSSVPRNYDSFIDDIKQKMVNTLQLFIALYLGRHLV